MLDFERIRASKELVITEIERNGFAIIQEIKVPGLKENYLLHFRKKQHSLQSEKLYRRINFGYLL